MLFAQALAQGDEQEALAILEAEVHVHPSKSSSRNRLAKMLIASGKAEEAIGVLAVQEKGDEAEVVAETHRLRGMAEVLSGGRSGLKSLQAAVRTRPWDDVTWQSLAWARKPVAEVGKPNGSA